MCNTVGNTVCCLGGHWDDPNVNALACKEAGGLLKEDINKRR